MSDVTGDGKIECKLCGSREHVIKVHLSKMHTDVSIEEYQAKFPEAPLLSVLAQERIAARGPVVAPLVAVAPVDPVTATVAPGETALVGGSRVFKKAFHEVFGLGNARAARGHENNPIPVVCMDAEDDLKFLVHDLDPNYVYNIELLKTVMMGMEMNIPTYLWGHAGVGKSTIFEQVSARTGRPCMRVQHTMNTEEAHVLGMWKIENGETKYQLGPLPYCMKHGLTYLADEYDFAMPAVTALYQPVLEGKALLMKEADMEHRHIKPHPLFRFVATGNTNGTGDDTGLYQGTRAQNAANYERFGIVEEVRYMEARLEEQVVAGQSGVSPAVAKKLVQFANLIREAYSNGKINLPVSPRALINAGKNGNMRRDYEKGLQLAFINRLTRIDAETAREVMSRIAVNSAMV